MQDHEFIERIKSGDIQAFKQFFETYRDSVFNLCRRFVICQQDAEDLCQDIFFKIYRKVNTFKQNSKLSTWVYRICINECLNYKRKHRRFNWLSLNPTTDDQDQISDSNLIIPASENPDSFLEQKEREQIILRAINSLPKNQRVTFVLQRYEGMSIQQISDLLGCSTASVQSRLARAKKTLAQKLLPYLKDL